ncbi:MAG: hypothetical protein K0Q65_3011 [Clostridia bacterium]|nr:hypothetical protein [Clostridia bacterium]
MGINYSGAIRSGRNLSSMGNDVERLRTNAKTLTDNIPSGYDGQDARTYMNAVEQLQRELKSISNELKSLGSEVISVAEQIRREEEEEERRRREAAMRRQAGTYW